jgi:hypothetical protein
LQATGSDDTAELILPSPRREVASAASVGTVEAQLRSQGELTLLGGGQGPFMFQTLLHGSEGALRLVYE